MECCPSGELISDQINRAPKIDQSSWISSEWAEDRCRIRHRKIRPGSECQQLLLVAISAAIELL